MSIFPSSNSDAPVIVEEDFSEEDYATAEEPEFGENV